jgi:uncharacterized XkdX family phage protein
MTFERIKKNYDRKLWNKMMVAKAVEKMVITAEQYKEITGEDYIHQEVV